MQIRKPAYYDEFHCIAGACPDSCCKEWTVAVDEDAAAYYRALPGALGDCLRTAMGEENGDIILRLRNGRCPMWRDDGLCRLHAEFGEGALCVTCRDFPRLTHDYGSFCELGLELSCPEAARLILGEGTSEYLTTGVPGGETPEYDKEAMDVLQRTRQTMRAILSDGSRPVNESLALALMYGYHAQAELDGEPKTPFDENAALEEAWEFAGAGDMVRITAFFGELEILSPAWAQRLREPKPADWAPEHRALALYFIDRYYLQAVSDYDLVSRIKFMVISCLLVRHLGGNLVAAAQRYSKEIENDIDNLDAILDAAYENPAFTDASLLGLLLL